MRYLKRGIRNIIWCEIGFMRCIFVGKKNLFESDYRYHNGNLLYLMLFPIRSIKNFLMCITSLRHKTSFVRFLYHWKNAFDCHSTLFFATTNHKKSNNYVFENIRWNVVRILNCPTEKISLSTDETERIVSRKIIAVTKAICNNNC